jgi:palmitoyltransferase
MLDQIREGRTDLVFEYLAAGNAPTPELLRDCAYYGDVSAIKYLLTTGAQLDWLGDNLDLNGASFHGHWRLCAFLIERGADVNLADRETGETPLHSALCTTRRVTHNRVMTVLLANGADPNRQTKPGVETGGFMRDVRTKGETPLHRAAAFGDGESIEMLLNAGAQIDAKDAFGDAPLSWASWHLRPTEILRLLCYGEFSVRAGRASMEENLAGWPNRIYNR